MNYKIQKRKYLADTLTPVNVYLKLRDQFPQCLLLESSDYNSAQNSKTFIVFNPLRSFELNGSKVVVKNGKQEETYETSKNDPVVLLKSFRDEIAIDGEEIPYNGLYGFTSFEAVKYFDSLNFEKKDGLSTVPVMQYAFYRFIICINHFNNEMILIENCPINEPSQMDAVEINLFSLMKHNYPFSLVDVESAMISDDEFRNLVIKGKEACQIGNVFQIVFARRFQQSFLGDEFNVYRALRAINPSPYLFYFNYGNYKLMGSSPEAQLIVKDDLATIHPIAGTYKKTGDVEEDEKLALLLSKDPKENAEHTMLVDLARNDLSKFCNNVTVDKYKEIQHFSHVIHLVSEVTGVKKKEADPIDIFAASFPAGTLSGAPKFKALKMINELESHERSFYGGAIGYFGLNGDVNHAITIRSFLSNEGCLHYQAGAGIVVNSNVEGELQEVNNKLGALRDALKMAVDI